MKSIEQVLEIGLAGIIPVYKENLGDATLVLDEAGGEFIDKRSLKSVLRRIARYYSINLTTLREKSGKILGQKNTIPLPFAHNLLLVPFKRRKPKAAGDATIGYIAYSQIEEVIADSDSKVYIILKNKREIQCISRKVTIEKHIKDARILQSSHDNIYRISHENNLVIDMVNEEHYKPATKGDVAMIFKEISEIKDRLF